LTGTLTVASLCVFNQPIIQHCRVWHGHAHARRRRGHVFNPRSSQSITVSVSFRSGSFAGDDQSQWCGRLASLATAAVENVPSIDSIREIPHDSKTLRAAFWVDTAPSSGTQAHPKDSILRGRGGLRQPVPGLASAGQHPICANLRFRGCSCPGLPRAATLPESRFHGQ